LKEKSITLNIGQNIKVKLGVQYNSQGDAKGTLNSQLEEHDRKIVQDTLQTGFVTKRLSRKQYSEISNYKKRVKPAQS
jgi:hypothetical protein